MSSHELAGEGIGARLRVRACLVGGPEPRAADGLFQALNPDHAYVDQASGASTDRPKLKVLLKVLRRGDTLVVKSPDRLARNTVDLLNIAHELRDKGVDLEFLDTPALNVDSATGGSCSLSTPASPRSSAP